MSIRAQNIRVLMLGLMPVVASVSLDGPSYGQSKEMVKSRLSATVHECERDPQNIGTVQQAGCYADEEVRQDKILDETWARTIAHLPPDKLVSLRKDERAWIKLRDRTCMGIRVWYRGSTEGYMYNSCMTEEDIRRTIWLERGAKGAFVIPQRMGP